MPVIPAEEYERIRDEWHKRRIAALKEAGFRCVVCGRRRGLEVEDIAGKLVCICERCFEREMLEQRRKRITELISQARCGNKRREGDSVMKTSEKDYIPGIIKLPDVGDGVTRYYCSSHKVGAPPAELLEEPIIEGRVGQIEGVRFVVDET